MSEHAEAAEALGRSLRMEKAARRDSGWYSRYLLIFAVAQLGLVPTVLLLHGTVAMPLALAVYVVAVSWLSLYATRRRAVRRAFGLRHGLTIGIWGALYTLTISLGPKAFPDSVTFAVGAALVCTLPLAVGGWIERRLGA